MIGRLAELILVQGLDDWVDLVFIEQQAQCVFEKQAWRFLRVEISSTLLTLQGEKLVEIGTVLDGAGFVVWPQDEVKDRIDRILNIEEEYVRGFALWTNNTPTGDEIAREVMRRDGQGSLPFVN